MVVAVADIVDIVNNIAAEGIPVEDSAVDTIAKDIAVVLHHYIHYIHHTRPIHHTRGIRHAFLLLLI